MTFGQILSFIVLGIIIFGAVMVIWDKWEWHKNPEQKIRQIQWDCMPESKRTYIMMQANMVAAGKAEWLPHQEEWHKYVQHLLNDVRPFVEKRTDIRWMYIDLVREKGKTEEEAREIVNKYVDDNGLDPKCKMPQKWEKEEDQIWKEHIRGGQAAINFWRGDGLLEHMAAEAGKNYKWFFPCTTFVEHRKDKEPFVFLPKTLQGWTDQQVFESRKWYKYTITHDSSQQCIWVAPHPITRFCKPDILP